MDFPLTPFVSVNNRSYGTPNLGVPVVIGSHSYVTMVRTCIHGYEYVYLPEQGTTLPLACSICCPHMRISIQRQHIPPPPFSGYPRFHY